jgi:hypothetical protein
VNEGGRRCCKKGREQEHGKRTKVTNGALIAEGGNGIEIAGERAAK